MELADLDPDPLVAVRQWLADAVAAKLPEPTAMTLATASADGRPSARTVLLKDVDTGFVLFTNYESRKGTEAAENPRAALVLHWRELGRQICVTGDVRRLPRSETEAYFATRPRGSQLGAWASPQSRPLRTRDELDARFDEVSERFGKGVVPAPPHWGGLRVVPLTVELWQQQPSRLHDRIRYRRTSVRARRWVVERLAP